MPYLRCPVCGDRSAAAGDRTLRCPRGHSFDIARQGYVEPDAGPARRTRGDTAEMVAARAEFLAAGHYDFVADAAGRTPRRRRPAGWSSTPAPAPATTSPRVLDALPGATGLALDVSKPALRRAARAHPGPAPCSPTSGAPLPLADGAPAWS